MSTNEKMNGMTVALVVSTIAIIVGIFIGVSTLISKYIKHTVSVDDAVKVTEVEVPDGGPIFTARSGSEFYDASCKACHGSGGEGSVGPNLTILDKPYMVKQYNHIMAGDRKGDLAKTMVEGIKTAQKDLPKDIADQEIKAVLKYVASLPIKQAPLEKIGDPVKGKASYMTCAACHGMNGEGNPMLKSPAIGGQKAQYIFDQVMAIKGDKRPIIPEAVAMKAMVGPLSEQQIKDLATYINSLSGTK